MDFFKKTVLATTTVIALSASSFVYADTQDNQASKQMNRISAFTGSTYGTSIDIDMTGVRGLYAFDDRYVISAEYADLDLGIPVDTSMTTIKVGIGSQADNGGWGYYYLAYMRAEAEFMNESSNTDAYALGLQFITNDINEFEATVDFSLVKPEDDDVYLDTALELNYFVTDILGVGAYASIDTEGDGRYGLSATFRF